MLLEPLVSSMTRTLIEPPEIRNQQAGVEQPPAHGRRWSSIVQDHYPRMLRNWIELP